MWSFIKLAVMTLAGCAIFTAPPQDQLAMAEGAKALGRSVVASCTRPEAPCRRVIEALRPLALEFAPDKPMFMDAPSRHQQLVR